VTEAERRAALEQVADDVRACTACRLHEGRSQAVPGEGHPSTEVLFIGEAPGLNEDRQGRPFVGAAGQFLTELLGSLGWRRDEVFITNVVKCRPPQNRDPEPDEIEACGPFLRRQLDILDPALVVTLGRHSMARFMPGTRIGQVHGTFRPGPPELGAGDSLVFAMYHPAAALHQGSLRQTLLDDMGQVPAALLEARRRRTVDIAPAVGPAVVSAVAQIDREAAPALERVLEEPGPANTVVESVRVAAEPTLDAAPPPADAGPIAEARSDQHVGPDQESGPPPAAASPRPEVEGEPVEAVLAAIAAVPEAAHPSDVPDDQMTLF
jgi:uracil-DNA glycosylase family 4